MKNVCSRNKGVYITSKLRKDQSIVSLISYDKGATWDNFTEPLNCDPVNFPENKECNCNKTTDDYCHLQLHASFSMAKGVDLPEIPYSTENAPGLILGHGNVGDSLSTDTPDLYVSSDGGYKWNRALQGAHRTAIGMFYILGDLKINVNCVQVTLDLLFGQLLMVKPSILSNIHSMRVYVGRILLLLIHPSL